MSAAILEISGIQVIADAAVEQHSLYVDLVRVERWSEAGDSIDIVFIDRGSAAHEKWTRGELSLNETDTVLEADLHQEWLEFGFESDDAGDLVTIGGAIGIDTAECDFQGLVDSDLYVELTCREDGDAAPLPITFTDECSGTIDGADLEWSP